ncbi:lysozyme inhibitor LprI family protein [Acidithiobacillus sp. IBUN Pt1247-S3]|uniref:lysozyme inhibitor LprI family protein n=1 Tax=Acidithiobacillus sp. IBUN Pt1247-S3 TaxID=3166642 RepID=UPI0034E3C306
MNDRISQWSDFAATGKSAEDRETTDPIFCKKAAGATETTICKSEKLRNLDNELNARYSSYRDSQLACDPLRDQLKTEQLAWLKQRNACGADAACIERAYKQRLTQLPK